MNMLYNVGSIPKALMSSISVEQDVLCRTIGLCIAGEEIDSEIGDLKNPRPAELPTKKFTYMRYDHIWTPEELDLAKHTSKRGFALDNLGSIPTLQEVGRRYAEEHVMADHLPPGVRNGNN